jgi:hypothetical protein
MKKLFYVFVAAATMVMVSCGGSSNQPAANSENSEATEAEATLDSNEEAAAALLGAYDGVADVLAESKSKDDVVATCQALGETLQELEKEYPNFEPDEETAKIVSELSEKVGEAIGTVGLSLGMSQEEMQECLKYISAE